MPKHIIMPNGTVRYTLVVEDDLGVIRANEDDLPFLDGSDGWIIEDLSDTTRVLDKSQLSLIAEHNGQTYRYDFESHSWDKEHV